MVCLRLKPQFTVRKAQINWLSYGSPHIVQVKFEIDNTFTCDLPNVGIG